MKMQTNPQLFQFQMPLSVSACTKCGCVHAVPQGYKDWVCPNGHRISINGKTHEAKQKVAKKLSDADLHVGVGRCPYCKKDFNRLDRHLRWKHQEEQGKA